MLWRRAMNTVKQRNFKLKRRHVKVPTQQLLCGGPHQELVDSSEDSTNSSGSSHKNGTSITGSLMSKIAKSARAKLQTQIDLI